MLLKVLVDSISFVLKKVTLVFNEIKNKYVKNVAMGDHNTIIIGDTVNARGFSWIEKKEAAKNIQIKFSGYFSMMSDKNSIFQRQPHNSSLRQSAEANLKKDLIANLPMLDEVDQKIINEKLEHCRKQSLDFFNEDSKKKCAEMLSFTLDKYNK